MPQVFANAARTTLLAPITAASTTLTLADGSRFPAATPGGDWFYAVLQDEQGIEVVRVEGHDTANTPNSLTNVTRGADARAFAAGAVVGLRVTAEMAAVWEASARLTGGADANFIASPQVDGTTMFTGFKGIEVVATLPVPEVAGVLYLVTGAP